MAQAGVHCRRGVTSPIDALLQRPRVLQAPEQKDKARGKRVRGRRRGASDLKIRLLLTPKMEGKQFLKSYGDNIRCSPIVSEEIGNLERGGEPVDQVLRETLVPLQVGIVSPYLYEYSSVEHRGRGRTVSKLQFGPDCVHGTRNNHTSSRRVERIE